MLVFFKLCFAAFLYKINAVSFRYICSENQ